MAFNNYVERPYSKFTDTPAAALADHIITDLKDRGIPLGQLDFYAPNRFTLIILSQKGTDDDSIVVGQSTTFPDRISIKVDDTVSEEHRADSIGYIDEDVNGNQTFKLFNEAGSLAALKTALTLAAEGGINQVTIRVSPTLTPEYTNPKFKGGSVSFADLNLEGKRQDLIVLRMEESRGLFGSRDTTADPLRYGSVLPDPHRLGALFVLRKAESDSAQPNGLYLAEPTSTTDQTLRWVFATDSDASIVPYNIFRQLPSSDFEVKLNSASAALFGTHSYDKIKHQWTTHHDHELFITSGTRSEPVIIPEQEGDGEYPVSVFGYGDILYQHTGRTSIHSAGYTLELSLHAVTDPSSGRGDTLLDQVDLHIMDTNVYTISGASIFSKLISSTDLNNKYLYLKLKAIHNDPSMSLPDDASYVLNFTRVECVITQLKSTLIGATGEKGEKGDTGEKGEQGEHGLTGSGVKGDTGEQGTQGPPGSSGPVGRTGETGAKGDKGDVGPRGAAGPDGTPGQDGQDGADGRDGESGTGIEHLEAHTETTILNGEPDFEHERTPPYLSPNAGDGFGIFSFFYRNKTQPVQILNIPDSYRTMPGNIPFTASNMIPAYDLSRNVTSAQETGSGFTTFNYAHIKPDKSSQQIRTGVPLTGVSARNRLAKSANLFFKHGMLYGIGKDFSIASSSEDKFRFFRYTYDDTTAPDSPFIKVFTGGQDGRFGRHSNLIDSVSTNTNMGVAPVVLEYKDEHYVVRSSSPGGPAHIEVSKINSTPNEALDGVFELSIAGPSSSILLTDGGISSLGVSIELHNQVKSWVVGRSFVWIITTLGYYKVPVETFFNPPSVTSSYALIWRDTLYHGEPARTSGAPQPTLAQQSKAGFILDETHEYIALQADPGTSDFNQFYGRRFGLSHGAFSEIEFTDSSNDDALITKTDLPVGVISEITANYGRMELHVEENIGGRVNAINADITPIMQGLSLTGIAHDTRNFRTIPVLPRSSPLPGSVSANASVPAVANFDIENDVLTISEFTPTNGTPILTRHFDDYIGDLIKMEFDTTGELFGAFFIDNIISRHETTRAGGVVHDLTLKIAHMRMNFGTNDRKTDFAIAFRSTTRIHFVPMQQRVVDISEYQKKSDASGGVDITYGAANPNGGSLGQPGNSFIFTTAGDPTILRESDDAFVSSESVQNPQRILHTSNGHPAILWSQGDTLRLWVSSSSTSADGGFTASGSYPDEITVTTDQDGTARRTVYVKSRSRFHTVRVQAGGGVLTSVSARRYELKTGTTSPNASTVTLISSTVSSGSNNLSISAGSALAGEENDLYAQLADGNKVDALYAYRGTLWEKLSNPGRPSHRSVSVPINAYTGTGRTRSLSAASNYTMYAKENTTGQPDVLKEGNFWTQPLTSEPPPHTTSASTIAYPSKAYLWAYVPCKAETHNLSGGMSIDVRTRVAPSSGTRDTTWARKMKLRYEYFAIGEKTGVPLFTKTSERHATYTGLVEGDEIITEFSQDNLGGWDEKNIRCKLDLAKYFTSDSLAKVQGVLVKIYLGDAIHNAAYTDTNNFLRTEDTVLFPTGNGFTFNYEDPEE